MLKLLIYEKYDRARHGHDISDILASIYHLILDVDTFFLKWFLLSLQWNVTYKKHNCHQLNASNTIRKH